MRIAPPNFTQTPNELFDEWLSKLEFVELKVLMVIMRKTFGWHKIRDRISLSQLELHTGSLRKAIIRATRSLEKRGLISKITTGKNGEQETFYELIIEDSNNFYQCPEDTPTSVLKTPTKETLTKDKKKNLIKRNPKDESPAITFNGKTRKFEGITSEDVKAWKKAHPAISVEKVIDECAIWAFSNPREHYRISLNTFMLNKEKNHTTPYVPKEDKCIDVLDEDVAENIRLAKSWEAQYEAKKMRNYELYARPTNILFVFPNNSGDLISYEMSNEEFKKRCHQYLIRLKLKN